MALNYVKKLGNSLFDAAAYRYSSAVGNELRRFGLRYDDLLDPLMDLVRFVARVLNVLYWCLIALYTRRCVQCVQLRHVSNCKPLSQHQHLDAHAGCRRGPQVRHVWSKISTPHPTHHTYENRRLPKEVVDARNQRLYRAVDLSMKHESLPKELQEIQDPFKPTGLQDMVKQVKLENAERAALEATSRYDRQVP